LSWLMAVVIGVEPRRARCGGLMKRIEL